MGPAAQMFPVLFIFIFTHAPKLLTRLSFHACLVKSLDKKKIYMRLIVVLKKPIWIQFAQKGRPGGDFCQVLDKKVGMGLVTLDSKQ